jgi:hypothetical protein
MVMEFTNLLWPGYIICYVSGGVSSQLKGIEPGFEPNLRWTVQASSAPGKE